MFTVKHYRDGTEIVDYAWALKYYGPLVVDEKRDVRAVYWPVHVPEGYGEEDEEVILRGGRVTVLNDNGAEVAEYDIGHAVTVGDEPDAAAFHWPPCGITGVLHALATEGAPV